MQCRVETREAEHAVVTLTLEADGQATGFVDEWFPELTEGDGGDRPVYGRGAVQGGGSRDGSGQRAVAGAHA